MINTFYFLNLIPPVPLALEKGFVAYNFVAYNVVKSEHTYEVTYENVLWYQFWNDDYRMRGLWEVDVITEDDQTVGNVNFEIDVVTSPNRSTITELF